MALFNYATKEITLKIVYYGPGLSGKTTNIQHLHAALNPATKGKLLSLSTESDRTLFFDFLPVELGKIREFSIRFQLYTVPGQVRYNATRKVVLKGADAVVFVLDSQREMRDQNIESFENMQENLISNNIDPEVIPIILQYNKRDLNNILSVDALNDDINKNRKYEIIEAEAINGKGVEQTFQLITRLVLKEIARKHKIEIVPEPLRNEVKEEAHVQPKKREEEAVILTPPVEAPPPVSEEPVEEPDLYELEEEVSELVEPEYSVEEQLKETFRESKVRPEPAPDSLKKGLPEKPLFPPLSVRETAHIREPRPASDERSILMSSDITRFQGSLTDLKGSVASLRAELREIKDILAAMKDTMPARDDKQITEIRKEQREVRSILTDITVLLNGLKIKRSWFRF